MDTKTVTQSVDEATKALKSSLTEGSSKLFGSVMDAKRGLFGGITSTFDHVVNIVGGPDDGSKAAAGAAAAAAGSAGENPIENRLFIACLHFATALTCCNRQLRNAVEWSDVIVMPI